MSAAATVLLLPVDEPAGRVMDDLTRRAGYSPRLCGPADDPALLLQLYSPNAALVDVERPLDAGIVPSARRAGALVVYVSQTMSAYELATLARRRGAAHFPRGGGPALLRRIVEDGIATAGAFRASTKVASSPLFDAAVASVARSTRLVAEAREAVDTARELRAANRLTLMACRASRETIRDSVVLCTRELRDTGVPLERVLSIVKSALAQSRSGGVRAHVDPSEAVAWCMEAYCAA